MKRQRAHDLHQDTWLDTAMAILFLLLCFGALAVGIAGFALT